jgi:hypothetical protein
MLLENRTLFLNSVFSLLSRISSNNAITFS